ncbi:MAG: hypothetical protein M3P12_10010 [Gemmatimonadota bacterium]|nr:hypothetical protein [Gemmatimonadota bacterium]
MVDKTDDLACDVALAQLLDDELAQGLGVREIASSSFVLERSEQKDRLQSFMRHEVAE